MDEMELTKKAENVEIEEMVENELKPDEFEKVAGGSFGDVFKKLGKVGRDMLCPKCNKMTMYNSYLLGEGCKRCKRCNNCGYIETK